MNSIITLTARKKMAEARAGVKAVPPIVKMAVGDGGIDADGTIKSPESALNHELLRRDIDSVSKITDTCYRYKLCLKENELPKSEISELALIDAEGDIVSIITFEKKVKDEGAQMIFEMDDEF